MNSSASNLTQIKCLSDTELTRNPVNKPVEGMTKKQKKCPALEIVNSTFQPAITVNLQLLRLRS